MLHRTASSDPTTKLADTRGAIERVAPVIALISTGAVISAYAINFYAAQLSTVSGDWGTFGDYVGGLLNPLFGFLTLLVALQVLRLQRSELKETKDTLQRSIEVANLQHQSSERTRYEATYVSCRDDISSATVEIAGSSSNSDLESHNLVTELSSRLQTTPPLLTINSHAISFIFQAPGYEAPPPIDPWDWSISHGNDAREVLRLMLPLCRSIGDTLVVLSSMPVEVQDEKFRRLRNSLNEWTLSSFAYFLVMHPDGAQYQTAASASHILANLNIQRALCFAKAYLPVQTYSIFPQE